MGNGSQEDEVKVCSPQALSVTCDSAPVERIW